MLLLDNLITVLAPVFCWFVASNLLLFFCFSRVLRRYWLEPVLQHPVVIFESDDWGPGPRDQTQALNKLRNILCRYTDATGRHPVITLGINLAAPQVTQSEAARLTYNRKLLSNPEYARLLEAVNRGVSAGVFALQLHGTEHYCPQVLIDVASKDAQVREWLIKGDQYSELLPDHLQSRWLNARALPTVEHDPDSINDAVAQEVKIFKAVFGAKPRVTVPNTFAWTDSVEKAWAASGISYLITCGKRFTGRDSSGYLVSDNKEIVNGEQRNGLTCLVRDAYFEPVKGHRAEDALKIVGGYVDCARPLLFETHRFNFVSLNSKAEQSFDELDCLVREIVQKYPEVRFISSEELGDAFIGQSSVLLNTSVSGRCRAWLHRVNQNWPFRKFSRFTGAQLVISLLLLGWSKK